MKTLTSKILVLIFAFIALMSVILIPKTCKECPEIIHSDPAIIIDNTSWMLFFSSSHIPTFSQSYAYE